MRKSESLKYLKFLLFILIFFNFTKTYAQVERPPQFVLMAFDGSLNLNMWEETLDFAQEIDVKFTYFISGVYFFTKAEKNSYYKAPGYKDGASAIGYSDSAESIKPRLEYLLRAQTEGSEIGSHANGHFDGTPWTLANWTSEFEQFDSILRKSAKSYLPESETLFEQNIMNNMIGFRAPVLGVNSHVFQVLNDHDNGRFRYDTSRVTKIDYWPQINKGEKFWNFPLVSLVLANSQRRTLSMDYNHYVAHQKLKQLGKGLSVSQMEADTYQTYINYFQTNYYGNRAPLHIGHHFSKWSGGAYWTAMKKFAKTVCTMPEVKCVTYAELVEYMDGVKDKIADFQKGNFTKLSKTALNSIGGTSALQNLSASLLFNKYAFMNSKLQNIRLKNWQIKLSEEFQNQPLNQNTFFTKEQLMNLGINPDEHFMHEEE